jgi:hypothetical protein
MSVGAAIALGLARFGSRGCGVWAVQCALAGYWVRICTADFVVTAEPPDVHDGRVGGSVALPDFAFG